MVTCLHIIASASLDWGGPARVIREMTAALADRGHRVIVLSADVAEKRRTPDSQPPFDPRVEHRLHRFDLARAPWPSLGLGLDLLRHLPKIDVAHVHGLFNVSCTAAMIALCANKTPYILRPCGMLDAFSLAQKAHRKTSWWRYLDGPSAANASAIQCSTAHEVHAVTTALDTIGRTGHVVECAQGVAPLPQIDPISFAGSLTEPGLLPSAPWVGSASLRTPPHPAPYLLFLGRIAEKKGLLPLVRALALDPTLPDLVIVGPDERGHKAQIERELASLNVTHRVHWVGPTYAPDAKARWYAHATAFCLPSADENFGLTVVEAARFGVPLLVSPDVGLAEHVAHHHAGLVTPAEPTTIATALRTLITQRADFTDGARALGATFDWPERAAAVEALYHQALSKTA